MRVIKLTPISIDFNLELGAFEFIVGYVDIMYSSDPDDPDVSDGALLWVRSHVGETTGKRYWHGDFLYRNIICDWLSRRRRAAEERCR